MYCPSNNKSVGKLGRIRWAGHVARMEETINSYWFLVRKREGKRSLWKI
jgi:hypothetical protein